MKKYVTFSVKSVDKSFGLYYNLKCKKKKTNLNISFKYAVRVSLTEVMGLKTRY